MWAGSRTSARGRHALHNDGLQSWQGSSTTHEKRLRKSGSRCGGQRWRRRQRATHCTVMATETSGLPSGKKATTRLSPAALLKRAWLVVRAPASPMAPVPCAQPAGTAMLNLSSASE